MKKDNKRYIDLTDIKEEDLDKTSSFTDLMTRSERRKRKNEKKKEIENMFDNTNSSIEVDVEEMIDERKKSTKDLTIELEKAKKEYNNEYEGEIKEEKRKFETNEENLGKTQILELTRQMRFNFEENKEQNIKKKKKGISPLNIIGEVNLLCIGYYIYLLTFTNYQDDQKNYLITGGIIILLVLLFGLAVVTPKKVSKFFNIINILTIIVFLAFNAYTLIN